MGTLRPAKNKNILLVIILVLVDTTPLIYSNAWVLNNNIDSDTKGDNGFLLEGRNRRGGHCYDNYIIILDQWYRS